MRGKVAKRLRGIARARSTGRAYSGLVKTRMKSDPVFGPIVGETGPNIIGWKHYPSAPWTLTPGCTKLQMKRLKRAHMS